MHLRLPASRQQTFDDRIIEHLDDESWSTLGYMEMVPGIDATKAQIRDRCRVLADGGLVALQHEKGWYTELTTVGEL